MNQQELQHRLLEARAYPQPPGTIEFRETHASLLFLTDCRVYKIKRPVNLGFLDFSTLELRHHFCVQEVLLNRRFSQETYLGVVPIRNHHNEVFIDGKEGEIIEYAVVMQRLPEDRMLHRLVERHDPGLPNEALRIGSSLAQMHAGCQICREESEDSVTIVRRNWEENFTQTKHYAGTTIAPAALALCRERIHSAIDSLSRKMQEREKSGLVRDGHGDLHADHICLTNPLCIYDCIEFNRRFRVGDILADLAFLLMDLDKRGARDTARIIEKTWSTLLGEEIDPVLLRFYEIYRAFVRGKVTSFLTDDPTLHEREQLAAKIEAREYFDLAVGYLVPQTLIITCGVMGVGKTTVSRPLARALRATHLRSDFIRKELFTELKTDQHRPGLFAQGLYTPERSQRTYDQLLSLTNSELLAGNSVVVDAAFARPAERQRFQQLAKDAHIPFVILYFSCDETLTRQRLDQRQLQGSDLSDGRSELLMQHLQNFQPPTKGEGALLINTGEEMSNLTQMILVDLINSKLS